MSGYIKKIAVIKQIKGGFSADGSEICGLVKAETYAGFLKVDASLLNFAPLDEGRYVLGFTDGAHTVTFEDRIFEGESDMDISGGFAFLVCFCHQSVAPIASASCGQAAFALPALKEEMTRRENLKPKQPAAAPVREKPQDTPKPDRYDDEAITETNYYEQPQSLADGEDLCPPEEEQEERGDGRQDAAHTCACAGGEDSKDPERRDGSNDNRTDGGRAVAADGGTDEPENEPKPKDKAARPRLAGGSFYSRMAADIEKIFAAYPRVKAIEEAMEGSRFVKIPYGSGRHYVFGVLEVEGVPRYICYGVPQNGRKPDGGAPLGFSKLIPTSDGGYYMLFQDAGTGVSVDVTVE